MIQWMALFLHRVHIVLILCPMIFLIGASPPSSPSRIPLLRYHNPHASPEIASHPSPTLKGISIHKIKLIPETGLLELGDIYRWTNTGSRERRSARLVEVNLERLRNRKLRPSARGVRSGGVGGGGAISNFRREGRVVGNNEVSPESYMKGQMIRMMLNL